MLKLYSIMAAAALIAGALVVAPSLRRSFGVNPYRHHPDDRRQGRSPRHGARLACRQQSWPYLDNSCIRDMRTESGSSRKVRVVAAGRK